MNHSVNCNHPANYSEFAKFYIIGYGNMRSFFDKFLCFHGQFISQILSYFLLLASFLFVSYILTANHGQNWNENQCLFVSVLWLISRGVGREVWKQMMKKSWGDGGVHVCEHTPLSDLPLRGARWTGMCSCGWMGSSLERPLPAQNHPTLEGYLYWAVGK